MTLRARRGVAGSGNGNAAHVSRRVLDMTSLVKVLDTTILLVFHKVPTFLQSTYDSDHAAMSCTIFSRCIDSTQPDLNSILLKRRRM